jgi:Plasmid replication region DNA-binding N-term
MPAAAGSTSAQCNGAFCSRGFGHASLYGVIAPIMCRALEAIPMIYRITIVPLGNNNIVIIISMENENHRVRDGDPGSGSAYASGSEALQRRVAGAAQAMSEKGIRPTVTRIRAALGGGSPNDLAPALKRWKEVFGSTVPLSEADAAALPRIPIQIADLAHELWQRANAAALVELKGGSAARVIAIRTEDVETLRAQVSALRDQLQRESLALGELRAQGARYEAMAHAALTRADEAEARERKHLRDLGAARQRITELEATVSQLRERPAAAAKVTRARLPPTKKPRRSRPSTVRERTKSRNAKAVRKGPRIAIRAPANRRPRVRRRTR